jgi:hypothetical protein
MKLIVSAVAAVAMMAVAVVLGSSPTSVQAAQFTIEGTATGAEEVPAVTGPGSARVRFVFDDVARTLTFSATVNGISPDQVTAAHIHRAARGSNGGIVHNLSLTGFTQISGTLQLSEADVADLRAGNFYFNVHSRENPGGFARFQLTLPASAPSPASATPATPATVSPPRTGDGGLADQATSLAPLFGVAVLTLSGLSILSLARKRV